MSDRADEIAAGLYQQNCGEDWDFTFDVAAALRDYAKEERERRIRLEVELKVRTWKPGFPSRPERWRYRGASSAWDSGFESGWLGHPFSDPYTRIDCSRAYTDGYEQGSQESTAEIERWIARIREGGEPKE